jgi:hypothetical protein
LGDGRPNPAGRSQARSSCVTAASCRTVTRASSLAMQSYQRMA